MAKDQVKFGKAEWLGGASGKGSRTAGVLVIGPEGIYWVNPLTRQKRGHVPIDQVAYMVAEGEQEAKSRAGSVVAFGVFGLGARSSRAVTYVTVGKNDGTEEFLKIYDVSANKVQGKSYTVLQQLGIKTGAPAGPAPVPASTADELGKLAELHRAGALSDEEFAAGKARLLG